LACKGCKADCPVSVDMATYKAEFASRYYAGRLRPRAGYALGRIHTWARLGSAMAPLANWVTRTPTLGGLVKRLGGIHPDRRLPPFSRPSFDRRLAARTPAERTPPTRGDVVFWPDTFNRYFHAETAMAGVEVLERLGFRVIVPRRPLCCGRPLYDFGWLDEAKRGWRRILAELRDPIRWQVPVVGLEPTCVAAFRDELPNLLPDEPDARTLADHTFLLAEFLDRQGDALELPASPGPVLLHGHCHEKAVLDWPAERRVLERLGATVATPETGCCGMAGAFGFDARHYDVAQACGELGLLPAVREREPDARVVANGFSCAEMIEQNTGVRALNLAEVLHQALVASGQPGPAHAGITANG
ncbi:MAG: hypothetical protein R2882_12470, partial [Gemmatimonadales bacterium]